jgi:hypothetical protein
MIAISRRDTQLLDGTIKYGGDLFGLRPATSTMAGTIAVSRLTITWQI